MQRIKNRIIDTFFDKYGIIFLACLLASTVFLIWKAPFGYVHSDEAFYLAIPYRLYQGDALIRNEWHPAQLFAVLTYPFMKLYLTVFGSTEGIALNVRYLYVAVQILASLWIFSRLRRFSPVAAILGTVCFALYAPLNIMALSYNTLSIMFLTMAGSTMATTDGSKLDALLSGVAFAGAVLGCPHLIAIYPLYCLICWIPFLRKKINYPAFEPKTWLYFTVGAACLAVIVLGFVFGRASVKEILATFPEFFNDSEHQSSVKQKIHDYFESFYGNFWFNSYTLSIPALGILVAADPKRLRHRGTYILCAVGIAAGYLLYYLKHLAYINLMMFPLNIVGLFAFFLCEKKDKRPFVFVFCLGFMYSVCIHFASNLAMMNISSAFSVALPASIYYICVLLKELWNERLFQRAVCAVLCFSLLIQLGTICFFKLNTMYDAPAYKLDCEIGDGALKGIKTSAISKDMYAAIQRDCAAVKAENGKTVVYYSENIWLYLEDEAACGAFSVWPSFIKTQTAIDRFEKYWSMYPYKIPDTIYVSDSLADANICVERLKALGFVPEALEKGSLLTKK